MAPALGGRILSFRVAGRELLWHDPALLGRDLLPRVPVRATQRGGPMATWQNWGGDKSWPAPQASATSPDGWPGPPDPVLDGGPWAVVAEDGASVRLRSGTDPSTGIRLERAIAMDSAALTVTTTVTNRSEAPRRVAAWEVMQVAVAADDEADPAARILVGLATGGRVVDLARYRGAPAVDIAPGAAAVRFGGAVAKVGFAGVAGPVACRFSDGAGLRLDAAWSADAPDAAPFQVWLQTPQRTGIAALGGWRPEHRLVELEPVGALTDLAPGASSSLTAVWTPTPPS